MKEFNLCISPCPNDTYIFYALLNNKLSHKGLKLNVRFEDVEQLNSMAINNEPDICKLSYHAYAKVSKNYQLLTSGGAFGINNGPIIVSKRKIFPDEIPFVKIAVPGLNTTAMMLLKLEYNNIIAPEVYVFNEIEEVVLSDQCDAGLIIHESRFTYLQKGLQKVLDLGEVWHKKYGLPVPLGGIAIRRDYNSSTTLLINNLIKESIDYAKHNTSEVLHFAKQYASEMDNEVMKKHIDLYVNKLSYDLGITGMEAVNHLYKNAIAKGIIEPIEEPIFVV